MKLAYRDKKQLIRSVVEFLKRVAHFSLATNEIQWRNLRCGGGQRLRTSFRRKLRRSACVAASEISEILGPNS